MSNEESMAAAAVASRRVPRQGVGGSPAGSTLSIVLAVVAVVAGFLILRNITDEGGTSAGGSDLGVTETTVPESAVTHGGRHDPGRHDHDDHSADTPREPRSAWPTPIPWADQPG